MTTIEQSPQSANSATERKSYHKSTHVIRTAFLTTSMPVGGAETLLVNLVRSVNRDAIEPYLVCMKSFGPLGEILAKEIPAAERFVYHKFDPTVVFRLANHFRVNGIQAVVTVGAGDKMFWGRIAAKLAGVKVICSALHSTGWPDGVGKLNRLLTGITDRFIAVANSHGDFLADFEKFPREKVVVIPNGVDTNRFVRSEDARRIARAKLGIANSAPLVGIVAALRPEKNHSLFIQMAKEVLSVLPDAKFVIVGEGPQRSSIEAQIAKLGIAESVYLLGNRSDTPQILAALDAFALTSHNEANPVSILEALSCEVPVVSTRVGSVGETVIDDQTGFTVEPGNVQEMARRVLQLLLDTRQANKLGAQGRTMVESTFSLDSMVRGYEKMIAHVYDQKKFSRSAE